MDIIEVLMEEFYLVIVKLTAGDMIPAMLDLLTTKDTLLLNLH